MKYAFWLTPLGYLLFVSSCSRSQPFPSTPRIKFDFINPSIVKADSGPFDIQIEYQDGDGDLGSDNRDVKNFFVVDNRTNLADTVRTFAYSLPNISSNSKRPSIQGTIKVKVSTGATSSSNFYPFPLVDTEYTSFSVYLVDRAGNKSNVITTSRMTVHK